jgi:RNA polymerase sigma factor (sigma-70 family)
MKQVIPDDTIKSYVARYNRGERDCYGDIVRILSPYIYNYPRIAFSSDVDRCGGFYEYLLLRLEKILITYRETQAKFVTWFTIVLRTRYFNYLRETRSSDPWDPRRMLSMDRAFDESRNLHDVIADHRNFTGPQREYQELIEKIVSGLRERQRIFFHLYHIETLRPEDVGFLSIVLHRHPREVLRGIDAVRSTLMGRYEKKNELFSKLVELYHRILDCQRAGLNAKAADLRRRRERVMEDYRRVKLNPSYRSIARFLDMPLGTVSTGIARMNGAVRKHLAETAHHLSTGGVGR